jgi:hypothetical protein
VFSSLGLYPTMAGANFFAVSTPQFPQTSVRIGAHAGQGGTLTIAAPGASDAVRYIRSARIGGVALTRTWVDWSQLARGGSLDYTLSASPTAWGTSTTAAPPSVNRAGYDGRVALAAALRTPTVAVPAGAGVANLQLDVLGQAPDALSARVAVTVPAGWRAPTMSPRSPVALVSNGLPVQRTVTVGVTVPAGTPVGSYPVTVTVTADGAAPVTRTATVAVRPPAACASTTDGQCAVDLTGERTKDGTATVAAPDEGNFDGGGWSYDGDLFPAAGTVTWGGTVYATPEPGGTAPNLVVARGQSILLPEGRRTALRLVMTSHNGPVPAPLTIGYADGSSTQAALSVGDWCNDPTPGTGVVLAMPHRIKAGQGVDGPPTKLFGLSVPLAGGKQVRSLTLPDDPRLHLYAVTLD